MDGGDFFVSGRLRRFRSGGAGGDPGREESTPRPGRRGEVGTGTAISAVHSAALGREEAVGVIAARTTEGDEGALHRVIRARTTLLAADFVDHPAAQGSHEAISTARGVADEAERGRDGLGHSSR